MKLIATGDLDQVVKIDSQKSKEISQETVQWALNNIKVSAFDKAASASDNEYLEETRTALTLLSHSTHNEKIFDRKTGRKVQDIVNQIVLLEKGSFEARKELLKHSDVVELLLETESNLLFGCEYLERSL